MIKYTCPETVELQDEHILENTTWSRGEVYETEQKILVSKKSSHVYSRLQRKVENNIENHKKKSSANKLCSANDQIDLTKTIESQCELLRRWKMNMMHLLENKTEEKARRCTKLTGEEQEIVRLDGKLLADGHRTIWRKWKTREVLTLSDGRRRTV